VYYTKHLPPHNFLYIRRVNSWSTRLKRRHKFWDDKLRSAWAKNNSKTCATVTLFLDKMPQYIYM
jgi:hypothetical protein